MIKFFGYDNKYLITSQDGRKTTTYIHAQKEGIISTFTTAVWTH